MVNISKGIKSKRKENKEFSKYNFLIENRRGWIRIIEVFIAILLMTGALLVVADRRNPAKENILSIEMSQKEIAILRDIQLNDTLRTEILNALSLPVEWADFDNGLSNVKSRIEYLSPKNFECEAKICWINRLCVLDNALGENVYAEAVVISANLNKYSPRQLKIFCVENKI